MDEIWRDVAGYDGVYQVSNAGRVRRTIAANEGRTKPGVLSPGISELGHGHVALTRDGKRKQIGVHRLVALAFIGPQPSPRHLVCHNNGDPRDNRVENLRWGTQSDNINDSVVHGTHRNTRKTHCIRGHELSGANLYRRSGGRRECRTCIRDRVRARQQSLTVL